LKHQAPTSKLQRSFNVETSDREVGRPGFVYAGALDDIWLIREVPDGNNKRRHQFDLEDRTARFGEAIIRFAKKIPRNPVNNRLIDQLVGCGTGIGGNYCEANEGMSKKDFRSVICRCVKEAKETKFFLRMVAAAEPKLAEEARELYSEAKQLHLIFASIFRKCSLVTAR
jgi:four helix bundle protein